MKNNNCPLWLRIAIKLPLRWKHRIRGWAESAEYWSTKLVLEDSTSLLMLIENTKTPNFIEFDRALSDARKKWGKHDSWLEGMAVRRRLKEFMMKNKKIDNIN